MKITVDGTYDGRTLLSYLKENGFSHATISKMKRTENGMSVNGEHVTVRYVLKKGDQLSLLCEDESDDVNLHIEPVKLDIEIVYEDDDLVVVNKPYGMPTIPSHNHQGDTLANALTYRYREQNFVFRAINRLDRNTSGLVLVAKNRRSAFLLYSQMQKKQIHKEYTAVLHGELDQSRGEIITYIKREKESIIKRICTGSPEGGAQLAHTTYRVERVIKTPLGSFSVVKASPLTGRTHQLRVHFAHIGHPICGDDLYGTQNTLSIKRQALHASTLEFTLPKTCDTIRCACMPAPDIKKFLKEIQSLENS